MFKRLVVYFYRYKNGQKQENCGYGKFNLNEGNCRLEINIKNMGGLSGKQKVYLYTIEKEIPVGVMIAEAEPQADAQQTQRLYLRYQAKCAEMGANLSLDEVSGIVIFDGRDLSTVLVGDMRENEIDIRNFVEKQKDNVDEIEINEVISTRNETFPQTNVENSDNSVYEYDEECLKNKSTSENVELVKGVEKSEIGCMDRAWQEKIFHSFPKVMMCINGEKTVGVKLRPHDVTWFPGTYWRMASNKFLLNGYYNYRYILFFRGTGVNQGKFYIGTPGCFGVSDAIVARKYGFTDFFSASGCSRGECAYVGTSKRNFGFWCCKT